MLGNARAKAVFHTHQHYATALDCMDHNYKLEMVHQNSARFYDSVCYLEEYNGIVESVSEGENLANMMISNKNSRIM